MASTPGIGSWWDLAACQSADPDVFFPVAAGGAGLAEIARAKAVCARCAVRQQCLDYALETRQPHGVWGGASEEERRAVVARRKLATRVS